MLSREEGLSSDNYLKGPEFLVTPLLVGPVCQIQHTGLV